MRRKRSRGRSYTATTDAMRENEKVCEAGSWGDANAVITAEIGQVLLRKLQCQVGQEG